MASTTFVNGVTLSDGTGWANDVDYVTYDGATTQVLVGGGAGVLAVWTTATGTGAPVRAGTPTFTSNITFSAASAKLIPGATNFSLRNNADNADNVLVTDAGAVTIRAGATITAGGLTVTAGNVTLAAGVNIFTGTSVGSSSSRWIGTDGGTQLAYNVPSGNAHLFDVNNTIVAVLASGDASRIDGGIRFGADSTNNLIDDASNGAGTATLYIGNAAITVASDIRLKDNIVDTERDALAIFDKLRVVDHTWNDPSDQCENNRNARGLWTGLIAQEADPYIPWIVNRPRKGDSEDFMWHMDLAYMAPLFVKGFQQTNQKIADLLAWKAKAEAAMDANGITVK